MINAPNHCFIKGFIEGQTSANHTFFGGHRVDSHTYMSVDMCGYDLK